MPSQVTFEDIVRYFRAENIPITISRDNRIALIVECPNVRLTVQVSYPWEKEIICLWAAYPFKADTDRISDALELAARINWGLLFATCEVDPSGGGIRFRSTMLVDDAPFHREQFATLFATACSTADRYAPAFRAVIERGESPADILAKIDTADMGT